MTLTWASSSLTLTVTTNKQYYYLGETVEIYGNLTIDGVPLQNALVGLEVTDPNKTIIIRTLPTSPEPQQNWLIEVLSVIPSDEWGNPKNSFRQGELSYFNITIRNNDIEDRLVLITVNVFTADNAPIGLSTLSGVITQSSTSKIIISVPIPKKATLGNATAYANVYSSAPRIGGKPYGPEKSAQFQIISSYESASTTTPKSSETPTLNGNYTTTFKLPSTARAGTFKTYVSSMYIGHTAVNNTTFYVKVPGDVNNDFIVDGSDLGLLGYSWYTTPEDRRWNENCDFDQSGVINGGDLGLMGMFWGYGL